MKLFFPHNKLSVMLLSAVLSLAACTSTPFRPGETAAPETSGADREKSLSPRAQLREYDNKAVNASTPGERAYYQLLAAELLMRYNKDKEVKKRLQNLNTRALDKSKLYRISLLNAQLALIDDNVPLALQQLPKNSIDYPLTIQAQILRTRAIALAKLGYLEDSLNVRLELDIILQQLVDRQKPLEANHQLIWSILQATPSDALQSMPANDPVLQGWIELVLNIRAALGAGLSRDLAINNWAKRFPKHPANSTLANTLRSRSDFISDYPNNIALLLPLSGRYSAQAKAIRDGFMTAYFNHDSGARPSIRVYDTSDDPRQIWLHYQNALAEGAAMIVGPLEKPAVSELASAPSLDIPVLALNYTENETANSDKVVQFGLLPEDEARQAAELAIIKGQIRAVIFAPSNKFGERLSDSFIKRYQELGGQVLAIEKYSTNTDDHGNPIQRALHIQQSKNRNSILRTVTKQKLKFEPRRRNDVNAIFLVANPRHARNFRTQLKFHNSGDVSIYTTSQAYTGIANAKNDRDLDGLVFTDMPWTLQGPLNKHFAAAASHWPKGLKRHTRLYALGLDAYRIIPYLNRLRSSPHERFPGLTGNIALNEDNRIHRELLWASFNKGLPEVLEFASAEDHNLFDPEDDISYLETP